MGRTRRRGHTEGVSQFVELTSLPSIHAAIVKGALEAEGVTVLLDRPALASVYALEVGTWATRLLVPEEQLAQAQAVLADVEAQDPLD